VQGGEGGSGEAGDVQAELEKHLKDTLGAFSVPLEMSDAEVLDELIAGADAAAEMPAALKTDLLTNVNRMRTLLLEESIARSIEELHERITPPNATDNADAPLAPPALDSNATARSEAFSLVVELLNQHDVELELPDANITSEIYDLVKLAPSDTRPGVAPMIAEAIAEWRRMKLANEAVQKLKTHIVQGLLVLEAPPDATPATAPSAEPDAAEFQRLVDVSLGGYDVPATMSDADVLKELVTLANIQRASPIPNHLPQILWLEAAIVDYRFRLAQGLLGAATTADSAETNETTQDDSRLQLLLPDLGSISASRLLEGHAEAVTLDNFALLMYAIMSAFGAHARLAIMCDSKPLEPAEPDAEDAEADEGGSGGLSCHAVVEVRLGKSPRKLSSWVAQHRKAQRALRKSVKGAKELWFRRDRSGYIWLPLRYQPKATEQLPGAPYSNYTYCMHYSAAGTHWEVEGEPLDASGAATSESWHRESILSTM